MRVETLRGHLDARLVRRAPGDVYDCEPDNFAHYLVHVGKVRLDQVAKRKKSKRETVDSTPKVTG